METVIKEMKERFHVVPVFQHTMDKRFVFPPIARRMLIVSTEILRPYKEKSDALIQAVKDKNERAVELLLEQPDCNVNQIDEYERTPLFIAVEKGFEKIVWILLKQVRVNSK